MKLLVFGKTGQVARELARAIPDEMEARFLDRQAADLSVPDQCAAAIAESDADIFINAAAWTAVDQAEADEDAATLVNGLSPGAMAQAAAKRGKPFLHISSDYVFDGQGSVPFQPADPTEPLGAYGRSKLAGEQHVAAGEGSFLILRTSWVFSAHGSNFVKTMLRLGADRDRLTVVNDQIGGPTPAGAIAQALLGAARAMHNGARGGIYHFAGAPDVSWADFAREIMAQAGLTCAINDIATEDYPLPARRPKNSRLDCSQFETEFGVSRPDWREELDGLLKELAAR